MKIDSGSLRRFEKRVRAVRAWRGLGIGLLIGAAACVVWAALDWFRIAYTEWTWMGLAAVVSGVLGAILGYFARISASDLAVSIDRRGNLQDRLTTSMEVEGASEFEAALKEDASGRISKLKPQDLYPVRVGKIQLGTVALGLLASMIFLLGNSPILLNPDARKEREELKKIGETVERIAKPLTEPDRPQDLTDAERRMADELKKLQRDLMKSKIGKEEALQKANELSKQTKELVKERAELTNENIQKAESALEKLQKAELEKAGLTMDPETLEALREMNREESAKGEPGKNSRERIDQKLQKLDEQQKQLEQKKQELAEQKSELQSKLSEVESKLKSPNLSPAQRKALEELQKKLQEQLKGLEKEMAEIQKAIEKIMKNKEVQELLRKISEHPKLKELQELAAKLAENAKMGENGEMPKLTKEDLQAMKEQIEAAEEQIKELAKQLSDPKALDEYLEQLREALANMDQLELNAGLCMACLGLFNLPGLPTIANPIDFMTVDTGRINKNESGKEGQGKTTLTQIKGDRQEKGDESYIEIKGPTTIGNRSGVKYSKVLPSYKKKAEEAMNRKTIPKQHEKRVKEYFESLTGGK